jgi:flagellar biogenesis protein FliO
MAVLGGGSVLSTLLPLFVILGVLLLAVMLASRLRQGGWAKRQPGAETITVLATRRIGPQNALLIVEAAGERFLVASGRGGVTAIGALGLDHRRRFSDAVIDEPRPRL